MEPKNPILTQEGGRDNTTVDKETKKLTSDTRGKQSQGTQDQRKRIPLVMALRNSTLAQVRMKNSMR
jgi:hypothetical protein